MLKYLSMKIDLIYFLLTHIKIWVVNIQKEVKNNE